jgi:hypothetical protein
VPIHHYLEKRFLARGNPLNMDPMGAVKLIQKWSNCEFHVRLVYAPVNKRYIHDISTATGVHLLAKISSELKIHWIDA